MTQRRLRIASGLSGTLASRTSRTSRTSKSRGSVGGGLDYHDRSMSFATIPDILEDLRAGRMIMLVDDENRENEGDFVVAAEFVTLEIVNLLTRIGGG